VTYPNGRVVYHNYPASGVGAKLSRLDNLAADAAGTTKYPQYTYLGADTIVKVAHPAVTGGLNLNYGTGGSYPGFDRFDRIVDQKWEKDDTTVVDRFTHTYDRNSNRLTRGVPLHSAYSEAYQYDDLNQLIQFNRTNGAHQAWNLDHAGNWTSFTYNATSQTRTHNPVNELTAISNWQDPTFDNAGNMTSGPESGRENKTFHYVWDAWNRLKEVRSDKPGQPLVGKYSYDGQHRRIAKEVFDTKGRLDYTVGYYYSTDWQVLEERRDGSANAYAQYVWDIRYLDAAVCRFRDNDGNPGNGLEETLYYTGDAHFNVTALVKPDGSVAERTMYDPYGKPTFLNADWTVRGSSRNDNEILFSGFRYDPETKNYQVRYRYYHPTLGRWASRDLVELQESTGAGTPRPAFVVESRVSPSSEREGLGIGVANLDREMHLYLFVENGPVSILDPSGLVLWNDPGTVAQQPRFVWDDTVVGTDYHAKTEGQRIITVWQAAPIYTGRLTYWCHGYTFDGLAAGPRSPHSGSSAWKILEDEWVPICCAAAEAGEDIIAYFGDPEPEENPWHSSKLIVVGSIDFRIEEGLTFVDSKWGNAALASYSLEEEADEYGEYRCYTETPTVEKILDSQLCCEPGDRELPLDSTSAP